MKQNFTIQAMFLSALGCTLAMLTGCQSTGPTPTAGIPPLGMPFAEKKPEIDYQQPVRMAVIWKESSVRPPGKPATRGFGGRVYFYGEDNEPVRVDGDLFVFAYDDSNNKNSEDRNPDRKYVFHASDLQRHHSETSLGDSYSVWLPWDNVGGERKTISLVPIFKPKSGPIPRSDHSIAVLSGKSPVGREFTAEEVVKADGRVRQVSRQVKAGEKEYASTLATVEPDDQDQAERRKSSMRTTTFDLSRGLANRAKAAARSNALEPKQQEPLLPKFNATPEQLKTAAQSGPGQNASPIPANPAVNKQRIGQTDATSSNSAESVTSQEPVGQRPARSFGRPGAFN